MLTWIRRHKYALVGPFVITIAAAILFLSFVTSPAWIVVVIVAAFLGDRVDKADEERQRKTRVAAIEEQMRALEAEAAEHHSN